jgi:hypothetical protein
MPPFAHAKRQLVLLGLIGQCPPSLGLHARISGWHVHRRLPIHRCISLAIRAGELLLRPAPGGLLGLALFGESTAGPADDECQASCGPALNEQSGDDGV